MCSDVSNLAKQEAVDVTTLDLLNGPSEEVMSKFNSAEARRLKAECQALKDLQDYLAQLACDLHIESVDVDRPHVEDVNMAICNIVLARALCRPLTADEKRASVVKAARETIALLDCNEPLDPALGMILKGYD